MGRAVSAFDYFSSTGEEIADRLAATSPEQVASLATSCELAAMSDPELGVAGATWALALGRLCRAVIEDRDPASEIAELDAAAEAACCGECRLRTRLGELERLRSAGEISDARWYDEVLWVAAETLAEHETRLGVPEIERFLGGDV